PRDHRVADSADRRNLPRARGPRNGRKLYRDGRVRAAERRQYGHGQRRLAGGFDPAARRAVAVDAGAGRGRGRRYRGGGVMATEIVQRGAGAIAPAAERDVMDLLARAVEAGASVEALERLVALKERVDRERARRAFFEALSRAQEEMPEVPKARTAQIATRSGVTYSYRYAALEDITRVIRPVLARHGLSYAWDVAQGDGVLIVTCVLRHVDGHEERASFPVP